ncbi:hypothetical protein EUX98_g8591 [Antrodiella citrinella]|uniref:Uncharacterized protein n=1 Tax=Antrodiella citrinella TaxID=2447956 RepID=A0A4V3XG91_9APHY|nr:hypothetical protein EUX98_g8591 [Antrodiella citrinella]
MSSPLLDLPFAVSINNTLGALYVGNVLVAIFFGITSAQVFLYFMRNPKDKLIYKIAVAVLWMIDTLHLVFVTHAGYHYGIINYGNPVALLTISWSLIGQVVLTTTSDAIVRSILAHRVWLHYCFMLGIRGRDDVRSTSGSSQAFHKARRAIMDLVLRPGHSVCRRHHYLGLTLCSAKETGVQGVFEDEVDREDSYVVQYQWKCTDKPLRGDLSHCIFDYANELHI